MKMTVGENDIAAVCVMTVIIAYNIGPLWDRYAEKWPVQSETLLYDLVFSIGYYGYMFVAAAIAALVVFSVCFTVWRGVSWLSRPKAADPGKDCPNDNMTR